MLTLTGLFISQCEPQTEITVATSKNHTLLKAKGVY